MIALDTNVVSELMRKDAAAEVVAWVDRQPGDQVFITAVTAAELSYGVRGPGSPIQRKFCTPLRRIVAVREKMGKPISMADAQIAAICQQYDLALGTRNKRALQPLAYASSTRGTERRHASVRGPERRACDNHKPSH